MNVKRTMTILVLLLFIICTVASAQENEYPLIKEGEKVQITLSNENYIFRVEPEQFGEYYFRIYPEFRVEVDDESELGNTVGYPIMAIFNSKSRLEDMSPFNRNFGLSSYFREGRHSSNPFEIEDDKYHMYSYIYDSEIHSKTYYLMIAPRVPEDEGLVIEFMYYNDDEPLFIGVKIFIGIVIAVVLLGIIAAMSARRKNIRKYGSIEKWREAQFSENKAAMQHYNVKLPEKPSQAVNNQYATPETDKSDTAHNTHARFCPWCGAKNTDKDARFCQECGESLE